uniref:Ribonuclease A-domain domain-containing protein n=1 Tax=Salarias fasciatus TaxID=181472 RepID=A0A672F2Z7_SALFA
MLQHKFKNQHIKTQMNTRDCKRVISQRGIFKVEDNKKVCKPVNTFILADESKVISVCQNGTKQGKCMKSNENFKLVTCRLTNNQADYPECLYQGARYNRPVLLLCENLLPFHYEANFGNCLA